jgi:tripartite-type tricarboxylate transporter receptor subunit TctC
MNGRTLWNGRGGKTIQENTAAGHDQPVQRPFMTTGAIVGAVLLIGLMVSTLYAQSYPNKPIRFIIPFPPGGAADIVGRIVGQKLAERLGQPAVPENRTGAGGNIAYELVAKAKPDGYTIILCSGGFSTSPSLYKKLNYDPIQDFTPISLIAQMPNVLLIRPSLQVNSIKELVAYAKANPGRLNYGSSGIGTAPHLAAELLKSLTKIDIMHVPYKGAGPALVGLMGGEIDMGIPGTSAAIPPIQAGKVRALAVLSSNRTAELPNVPTSKEAGIDNFEVTTWYGILAPAGTSRDIIKRLNAEWIKIAAMPDTMDQLQKAGLETLSGTPEQFSEYLKTEISRWAKVAKEANIPKID